MHTVLPDQLLVATLRAIGDGVISCDLAGRVSMMNPVAERLTGWSEHEALGLAHRDIFAIVHEKTREPVEDPLSVVLRTREPIELASHTVLLRRDGTEIPIDDSAAPVFDGQGELRGALIVFRDVTARRQAEWNLELLARSGKVLGEARDVPTILRRIGRMVNVHFADVGVFDLLSPSGALQRIVGEHRHSERQPVVDELYRFLPEPGLSADPARMAFQRKKSVLMTTVDDAAMQAAAMDMEHLTYLRERLKPRSVLAVPVMADGEAMGVLTFIRNTTGLPFNEEDRMTGEELGARVGSALRAHRAEAELQIERTRLQTVIDSVPVGIVVADAAGKIIQTNSEVEHIFRHGPLATDSVEKHEAWGALHPNGTALRAEEYPLVRAIQSGQRIAGEEYLYRKGDGSQGWISLAAAPMKDDAGTVVGGVVVISDIHERKRATELLVKSEDRFQRLIDQASIGINIGDSNGALSYANPALLKVIGYTREEVESGSVRWDQLTPPEYAERDRLALNQLQETGTATPYEKVYCTKSGLRVPVLIGATLIPSLQDADEKDIAVFFTDLTRQKQAEAVLLESEKLSAVGKLASSIAHEINNPLEAVTNLLFIVRQDTSLSQQARDYLDSADRELLRVSQVASQTLRFHRQSTKPTTVAPESLVDEVLQLYSARLNNSSIKVRREYASGIAFTCYEGDIRQVLNNIIGNAVDAMRTGGRLTVRTRYATRWSTGAKGVLITIFDTGTGMPVEVRRQVFDAFYTTKGIGGTGLGLWISCRIVHKHRGFVRAYSCTDARHHGSAFMLWLPVQLAKSAGEPWH